MPPRIKQIVIERFQSINDQSVIDFPENQPLVRFFTSNLINSKHLEIEIDSLLKKKFS